MDILLLAMAWLLYFALHSVLASNAVKQYAEHRYPQAMPFYRLFYNAMALGTLVPIIYLMVINPGQAFWVWPAEWFWIKATVVTAALTCFIWSLRYYDLKAFMGLNSRSQIKPDAETISRLIISPIHRFVRHPWYSCALFILWFRDMNTAQFVSTLIISAYFIVGTRLEEGKLIKEFGGHYERYQQKVPALIPLPWKFLSKKEALALSAQMNEA
ncbi:methyltransferase family protein [Pseudomonadota bacterium]